MPSSDRFFTLSPDLLSVVNMHDGRLMRVNPAACRILGWSEAELLHRPFLELVHRDDREKAAAEMAAAVAAGQANLRMECRSLRKDGSHFWTEWHSTYFPSEGLFYGIGRDITERKQAEAALVAAQTERNAVLESIADAFYSVDAEWRLTYANARATALLSRSAETMLGRRLFDLVSAKAAASPQFALVRRAMLERRQLDVEYLSDSTGRWIAARIYPRDDGGLSIYFHDITERKHIEEALRASRAHFEAVANLVPDMLWRSGPEGTPTWINQGWFNYHGHTAEELRDAGWKLLHPDNAGEIRASFEAAVRNKQPFIDEQRIRRRDGVYRWCLVRVQMLLDSKGEVTAWFGAATDIDDLKRAQGQQELLIAELQHRTRNLLAIVRSLAAQTLTDSASLEDFGERFNSRLGALSRVQSFLSQDAASDIGQLLRAELAAHGVEPDEPRVILEGPPVELPIGHVQPLALAVHELTTNALKHGAFATPSGRLAVRWWMESEKGSSLSFEWRESGVEMPKDEKPVHRGFGLDLIERGLPYQLGAIARVAFASDGIVYKLVLPLPNANPIAPALVA
ncbi:PAS domain S-box protein [Rhizorhabdus argentea]|uniref:PAS domain S-box protein n=1 Tax=Rhizorhabdus argentea TaxID=1387174 RepID=UPI0030EF0A42